MMSTVSEKLLQVAQNNPKVYHSGQLNIVKNAECLKGSKSSSAMLLDDVSPVSHDMGVKVRSKNLIPYPYIHTTKEENGITFTDNGDGSITISGKAEKDAYFYLCKVDFGSNNMWNESANNNGYYVSGCTHFFYNGLNKVSTIVVPSETDYSTDTITVKPQVELGTTATDYTPYVPDLTAVKVSRYGKNLLNQSTTELGTLKQGYAPTNIRDFEDNTWYAALTLSGYYDPNSRMPEYALNGETIKIKTGTGGSAEYYGLSKSLQCNPSTTYTLSYTMENGKTQNASGIGFYGADKKHISFVYCDSGSSFTTPSNCYWIIVCFHGNTEDTYVTYSNIQLELGTTATDYEPYITPTEYTSTADGTVNGVTSLYPNTTLTTDMDGVIIDCEYYKDIDKTFNELTTSVALSGGDS